jgi:hypothetical protein
MPEIEPDLMSLVAGEVARVRDPMLRRRLQGLLRQPCRRPLTWDYGQPGDRFECWVVGESPDGGVLLVHCARGFGPSFPWGFVLAGDDSMGMDSQWHSGLADAAIAAGILAAPPGYQAPGPRR